MEGAQLKTTVGAGRGAALQGSLTSCRSRKCRQKLQLHKHATCKHCILLAAQLRLRPCMSGVHCLHARQTLGTHLRQAEHAQQQLPCLQGGSGPSPLCASSWPWPARWCRHSTRWTSLMCSRCRLKSPQHRAHWTCILVPQLACLCTVPDMVFVHVASISLFSELEANVQDSVGRQMGLRLLMKFAGKPCSCLLSKHDLVYLPSLT